MRRLLVLVSASALLFGLAGMYAVPTVADANGTVKVNAGDDLTGGPENDPHVCTFFLSIANFDAGQTGSWWITQQPPTGTAPSGLSGTYVAASDGTFRAPTTGTYSLPDGHYKLYWQASDSEGKAVLAVKHKVFWVDCTPTPTPTPTVTSTPTGTEAPEITPIPTPTGTEAPEITPTPVPEITPTPLPEITATPAPEHMVTICHRTDSQTNPYVLITVDVAAVDGQAGNGQGDHLLEHQGDVWYPGHPKEPKWGDIIPSQYSDGTPDGLPSLNWTPEGQAIFDNGCKPLLPTPTPMPEVTPTPIGTEAPEITPTPTATVAAETGTPTPTGTPLPEITPTPTATVAAETGTPTPTGTPLPEITPTPMATVAAETGTPGLTPPPTDTLGSVPSAPSNDGWRIVLIGLAAVLIFVLTFTDPRRSSRRR